MTSTMTTGATTRLLAAAVAVAFAIPAAAQTAPMAYASLKGDAVKGEKVFVQCKTCHVVTAGVNRIGPSLHGIVGRHASKMAGYKYSAANIKSNLVWTSEVLFKYLEAPQKMVPGTKMAFAGLKKPQDRADVIAYLKKQV